MLTRGIKDDAFRAAVDMRVAAKKVPVTVVSVIGIFLSACTQNGSATECAFKYDNSIKEKIVLPLLTKEFSDASVYFDVDRPAIIKHGSNIELLFSPTKAVKGTRLLYENSFVIDLDACTNRVTDSYIAVAN